MQNIEGIAFDLDGTLYPNYRFNLLLLPFILTKFRLLSAFGRARIIMRKEQAAPDFTPKPGDDFYAWQTEITSKLLKVSYPSTYNKIDSLIYKGWEPLFKKVKLYENAKETLAAFKNAGCKLGLMSDFPVKTKLDYLGLSNFDDGKPIWDAALSSEECGALKPHPLPFIKLAAAMNLPAEKILYVGNSHSYDVIGASNAGMKTAWIVGKLSIGKKFKRPKADFIFNNYRQLLNFMVK